MVRLVMSPTRSQPGVARPFTESDLRRYPELIGQAIAYAINYSGTFEFMQQCQNRALREGTLPLNLCRAVLNCMRQDPDIVIEYEDNGDGPLAPVTPLPVVSETEEFDLIREEMGEAWDQHPSGQVADEVEEPRRERPRSIRRPAKIKYKYGISSHNGKVLHRVHPYADHYIRWDVDSGLWRYDAREITDEDTRRPILMVKWRCQGSQGTSNPILLNERPPDVPYCRSGCFAVLCPSCGGYTTLDNDQDPEDVPRKCRKCRQEFS